MDSKEFAHPIGLMHIVLKRFPTLRVQLCKFFRIHFAPFTVYKKRSPSQTRITFGASYIERQNLTMRMFMRRFTRLTNAFSKKIEHHPAAIALHYMYYNFCRIHQTLRVTPAIQAGISDRVWSIKEMAALTSN